MVQLNKNLFNIISFIFLSYVSSALFATTKESRLQAVPFNQVIAELYTKRVENYKQEKLQITFSREVSEYKDVSIYPLFKGEVTDTLVPGYSEVISHPMWVDKIKEKVSTNEYSNMLEFCSDYRLIAQNCLKFNDKKTLDRKLYRAQARSLLALTQAFEDHLLTAYELGSRLEAELSNRGEVSIPVYNKWVDSCDWLNEGGGSYWIQCDACQKTRPSPITYLTREGSWVCHQNFWLDSHTCDEAEACTSGHTAKCVTCQQTRLVPDYMELDLSRPWQCRSCEVREASPVHFSNSSSSTELVVEEVLENLLEQVESNVMKDRQEEELLLNTTIEKRRKALEALEKQITQEQQKAANAAKALRSKKQELEEHKRRAKAESQALMDGDLSTRIERLEKNSSEYKAVHAQFMSTMAPFVDPKNVTIAKIINPIQQMSYKSYCQRLFAKNKSIPNRRSTSLWQYWHHGDWHNYDPDSQKTLEQKFQSTRPEDKVFRILTNDIREFRINLNLPKFTQTNEKTKFERPIRRLKPLTHKQACVGEEVLYSGTGETDPMEIIKEGFQPMLGGDKRFYGRATYLAQKASYSHMYSYKGPRTKWYQIIQCNVAGGLGCCYGKAIKRDLRLPPVNKNHPRKIRYDSIRGGPFSSMVGSSFEKQGESYIHALYNPASIQARYVIAYLPKPRCSLDDIARQIRLNRMRKASSSAACVNCGNPNCPGARAQGVAIKAKAHKASKASAPAKKQGRKAPAKKKASKASSSRKTKAQKSSAPAAKRVRKRKTSSHSGSTATSASAFSTPSQHLPSVLNFGSLLGSSSSIPTGLSPISPLSPTSRALLGILSPPSNHSNRGGSGSSAGFSPSSSPFRALLGLPPST